MLAAGMLSTWHATTGASINASLITGLTPSGLVSVGNRLPALDATANTVGAFDLATGSVISVNPNGLFVVPVPEPSSSCMALIGLACGGFSMWRRCKQA